MLELWGWLAMGAALGWRRPAGAALALAWPVLALVTGDRRFFFPFAMQVAALAGPAWAQAGVVALFVVVRVTQSAPAGVLAVELGVAVAALALAAWVARKNREAAGALAALVGLLGLFL